MKIYFDNINTRSSSGPNGFAKKLIAEMGKDNKIYTSVPELVKDSVIPDAQLSFISTSNRLAPVVQRLDGIYFNSAQDFQYLNSQIEKTYNESEAVIFQSNFNKKLTESFFGVRDNSFVISNGTNISLISEIVKFKNEKIDKFKKVWLCASSWRPHKRLKENVRYFLEKSGPEDCLVIAGENPDFAISDKRIFYAGHVSWEVLIALMKRSDYFLHLAWLDHCPNVVVDARACGSHIVCSSSGGTKEIAGINSTVIEEDDWDFSPVELYNPPPMDFSRSSSGNFESEIDIIQTSESYFKVLESVLK